MARSIPEKTLEHWLSAYLLNRYPSATLWWPVSGADITSELRLLASESGEGKVIHLEVKTAEWDNRADRHTVHIDTAQLRSYLRTPTYYVFPHPFWTGNVASLTRPGGVPTDAYEWWRRNSLARRPQRTWFARWMYVMSAQEVLTRFGLRASAANPMLFSDTPAPLPQRLGAWGRSTIRPTPMAGLDMYRWRDFWSQVEECGPTSGRRWRVTGKGTRRSILSFAAGEEEPTVENLPDATQPDQVQSDARSSGSGTVLAHLPLQTLRLNS